MPARHCHAAEFFQSRIRIAVRVPLTFSDAKEPAWQRRQKYVTRITSNGPVAPNFDAR